MAANKNRVCYFYETEIGSFYYGAGHPMKPHRLRMTHNLLLSYGLYKKMEIYRPHPASSQEMMQFHAGDYVEFLRRISPDNAKDLATQMSKFNLGPFTDCPIFDGMYEFSQISAGGSLDGALKINHGLVDVAINWGGGLHHAKKGEASGFCYINDIVLAILELLKYHPRVLYIDIDIHHGDGVEEAFYTTDRVMTVSFHRFGDFFPGTGDIKDTGAKKGKNYSLNVPLEAGLDDKSFERLYKPILGRVMERFRPSIIVLQCGADSVTGDRIGNFNLTLHGHGGVVKYMQSFGKPMLVLGGGGYNIRHVSRCWAYETSLLLNTEISNNIPYNDYFQYYGPDFRLHITPQPMENQNSPSYLERIKATCLAQLDELEAAPSVQMHMVPPDFYSLDDAEEANPDVRVSQKMRDKEVQRGDEFYDGDEDNAGEDTRMHSAS